MCTQDVGTVPAPLQGAPISALREPGGVFAVRLFGGIASEQDAQREADLLK
jgi:hypothetical protein